MNKTVVYLGASASAEFLADIFLCPFEAIKVRMQTENPPFARTMREGISKVVKKEGFGGYVEPFVLVGLIGLWLMNCAGCIKVSTRFGEDRSRTQW